MKHAPVHQINLRFDAAVGRSRFPSRAGVGLVVAAMALFAFATTIVFTQGAPSAQTSPAVQFACPMHPDVRAGAPGACKRCGMQLVASGRVSDERYLLDVLTEPPAPLAAAPLRLRFMLRQQESEQPVRDFAEVHERLFHLFIVSDDLAYFDHVHPELQADGSLTVGTVLPRVGRYQLYADFVPQGGTPQFLAHTLYTAGTVSDPAGHRPQLQVDVATQKAAGVRVDLQLPPAFGLVAGELQAFRLHMTDADSNAPVADLQPFLGAPAHLLIVSDDLIDAFHTHPAADFSTTNGPDIVFETIFPRPGLYRMWVQFQRRDHVEVVSFTVRASLPPSAR
jgi:hypothetical protein